MQWLIAAGIYLYTSCSHEETFKLKDVIYDNGTYSCLYDKLWKVCHIAKTIV